MATTGCKRQRLKRHKMTKYMYNPCYTSRKYPRKPFRITKPNQQPGQQSPLMNHVPQCHFPTSQISPGLGSPRCPGQPLPVPGRPLREEILPESLSEPLPARTGLRGPSGSRAEARTWSCPAASPAGGPYPPITQQQHVVRFCSDRSMRTVIYSGKQPSFSRFISLPGSLISRSPHYQDVALSQG